MMKKLLILCMMLTSAVVLAQLPSWGMTEQQYKMPNRPSKLADIGKEAVKNKWQLKVIAPQAWHGSIRTDLSKSGELNVMMTFKDSLHQSVSITATKAKHMGQTVKSSANDQVVQKQVVIDDKPDIDTSVERPEFDDEFMTGKPTVAKIDLEMEMPKAESKTVAVVPAKPKPVTVTQPEQNTQPETNSQPKAVIAESVEKNKSDDSVEKARVYLRKRYAKNKKTSGSLPYGKIDESDDLYIKDGVVLVARTKSGRTFYYWMQGEFDQSKHKFKNKSQDRYIKTEAAVKAVEKPGKEEVATERTSLVLTAVTDNREDQDILRRGYIRNKSVTHSYSADKLKSGDLIYTRNDTALVVRRLSRTNEIYFWLKGDVNVTENITMMRPDEFKIK